MSPPEPDPEPEPAHSPHTRTPESDEAAPEGRDERPAPRSTEMEALAEALSVVGDRWTLLLVAALLEGPRRFGQLQEQVTGIAPNVLTQRLRQLERHGLVVAQPYSRRPPRFAYELSAAGCELAAPLRLLAGWGAVHPLGSPTARHEACGTPLELRWWCATCGEPVAEDGTTPSDDELHFA